MITMLAVLLALAIFVIAVWTFIIESEVDDLRFKVDSLERRLDNFASKENDDAMEFLGAMMAAMKAVDDLGESFRSFGK